MHIGAGRLWRTGTVIKTDPSQPVVRLKCPVYKQNGYFQGAGKYIVERRHDSVRKAGSGQAAQAAPVAPRAPATGATGSGGGLKVGEYAC